MAWHLEGRFHGFPANSPAGDGLRVVPGANRRASPHDGEDAQRIWWRERDRNPGKATTVMGIVPSIRCAALTPFTASCIPEEIQEGQRDAETGHKFDNKAP